jgi:hypothetical protein
MVLLSYGMLNRGQKTATRLKQQQIAELEDAYLHNEMDSFKFLEKCVVLLKSNFPVLTNIENRD